MMLHGTPPDQVAGDQVKRSDGPVWAPKIKIRKTKPRQKRKL